MAQFLFKVPQPLTKVGTKSPTNHLWCFTWIIKAITSSNLVKPHSLLVVVDVSRPVIIFPSHTNKISHGLFSNNAIFNFFRAEVGWFPKKIKWEKRFENGVVYFERYFWWHLLAEVVVLMLWREREREWECVWGTSWYNINNYIYRWRGFNVCWRRWSRHDLKI